MRTGEIILIEDDAEDIDFFELAYAETGFNNKLVVFQDPVKALEYIEGAASDPAIIISDVNMPRLNGFQVRERLLENPKLSRRRFPYLFLSTSGDVRSVTRAYDLAAQGYFLKDADYQKYVNTLKAIITYWTTVLIPFERV